MSRGKGRYFEMIEGKGILRVRNEYQADRKKLKSDTERKRKRKDRQNEREK